MSHIVLVGIFCGCGIARLSWPALACGHQLQFTETDQTMTPFVAVNDFFMCHTKQSSRSGWSSTMFVRDLTRLLRRQRHSVFVDMDSLSGQEVSSCLRHARSAKVLVCVLDDAFPTRWCLEEIHAAIANEVPIVTILDMSRFLWSEVGKDTWWTKRIGGARITPDVIDRVFARATIFFNGHIDYVDQAENRVTSRLRKLLPRPH